MLRRIFNLNDPQWGRGSGNDASNNDADRKPPQQRPRNNNPPDLDELWRDFNKRLNTLFNGGGKRPPDDSTGRPNPLGSKSAGIGAGLIIVILFLIWLASGFFIVQEGQVAVITQFGKYKSTSRSGFQWRIPYPIQAHEIVNVSQVRTIEVGYRNNSKTKVLPESLMLTDDENIIDIQFAVQYRIKDQAAQDYVFNVRLPEETVKQTAETAMREVVGKRPMDFVLYEGRQQVASDVVKLMQQILDRYKSGILISSVAIQNAQPPEQVQAAFDDAVKAGQDRERQINEGQAYANDVIPKASGAAARLTQEAEAYRQRTSEMAEGDAARFKLILTEYSKSPQVTRDRMYLDTMQQIYSNASKVMLDAKSGGSNPLLYLPLDKINSANAENNTSNAPKTTSSQASLAPSNNPPAAVPVARPSLDTPADTDMLRSRDVLRSREREVR